MCCCILGLGNLRLKQILYRHLSAVPEVDGNFPTFLTPGGICLTPGGVCLTPGGTCLTPGGTFLTPVTLQVLT